MKKILLTLIIIFSAAGVFARPIDDETTQNLNKLASEIASFVVGTPDKTFDSCTFTDGKITFVVNPNSRIGQYKLANPFEEKFYDNILVQMFSGNPQQGIMVMEYLKATAPQICFIIPNRMESTVYVGDIIPPLQEMQSLLSAEPKSVNTGEESRNSIVGASADEVKMEKGTNLVAALKAAKNVTYEYNADSGVWAHVGSVSIVINEDQLNQKGIDVINAIPSDIEPNLSFSPDYIKPDAKILRIEND